MSTMKAVVCVEPGRFELQECAIPEPTADEVIVRVEASGVCGSDVRGYHGTHPDIPSYPIILGHEFAGTVVEIGAGVTSPAVGTRVTVEPLSVCGTCRGCLRGTYQLCKNLQLNGHNYGGSFAEYTTAKAHFCFEIPGDMSMERAAFAEPVAVGVHTVKRSQATIGDFVVVLGAGPIGNLTMQVAKAVGAKVLITDIDPAKLDVARQVGADYVADASQADIPQLVRDLTGGDGADIVFECAGKAPTLAMTVDLVRKGGAIVAAGFTTAEADSISLTKITLNELSFLGTIIYAWDYPATVDLLTSGAVSTEPLVTHRYTLESLVAEVGAIAAKPPGMIKPMVLPN